MHAHIYGHPYESQKRHATLPTKVALKDFNRYIKPCLAMSSHGRSTKLSTYHIFNAIVEVLHTGMQWYRLKTSVHWSNIYRHHNRWSKDGSYHTLFEASLRYLNEHNLLDLFALHGDGSNAIAKKGGEGIGYSGHKHRKGEKILVITDNFGNILAPSILAAVHVNDSKLFPDSLHSLTTAARTAGIDLFGSFLTLDPAFYGELNQRIIQEAGLIPVIKPNHRNTKDPKIIQQREEVFADLKPIYHLRFAVERQFAWEDKYRKLVIRYETKQEIATGGRLLAASLVNFRRCFSLST